MKEKGNYRRFVRIDGKRVSRTFSRKQDADRWYQDQLVFKERLAAGFASHASTTTLASFAAQWLENRKLNGQPAGSYHQDEARLRLYVLPAFGNRILDTIKTREWEVFLNRLLKEKKLSPASRNRVRSLVSKLYNDARRADAASQNPISIIPRLKERMNGWSYWELTDDAAAYLQAARKSGTTSEAFAYLALNTGCRVGEICALDFGDIDFKNRKIHVSKIYESVTQEIQHRTKGFTERWLGMNDALFEALKRHRGKVEDGSPSVPLLTDENGKRLSTFSVRRMHERLVKEAGLKRIRVHDLRHTFASHYIMNGGSLAELQGLLGHTSPSMTLKYAHLAPGFLASKAKVVSFSAANEPEDKEPLKIVRKES